MQRFQQVVVYLESGQCDRTSALAIEDLVRRNGASLTLMSAVQDPSRSRQFWPGSSAEEAAVEAEDEIVERLNSTASYCWPASNY